MALNAWQKITRVIPGKPFGEGTDGPLTVSSNATQTQTKRSCSGASGQTNLTIGSGAFTNGDLVFVHQSRGTGVGQWEINKVTSGGGTTTLVMQENLQYTYTDSGASQAQVIKIPQYTNVTVNNTIVWSGTNWDGDTGGFLLFAANGTVDINGTLRIIGSAGGSGTGSASGGATGGFRGGDKAGSGTGNQGEGSAGAGSASTAANGNGGGGSSGNAAPGGGALGTAGTNGRTDGGSSGTGGSTAGNAENTTLIFGGGGGGCGTATTSAAGSSGGGAIVMFIKDIDVDNTTGAVEAYGANANVPASYEGGGGGGGPVLIECSTAALNTTRFDATGGTGFSSSAIGGDGRIAVHYGISVTGTTNPTATTVNDTSLVESAAGGAGQIIFI